MTSYFKDIPTYEEDTSSEEYTQLEKVGTLQVGYGSKVLRVDRRGIWLGAEDFADAPFSVDMEGNVVATSLDLSSYLQVGDALDDIQAVIGDLSDIDTNLGTITAGTLAGITVIGGTVKTSNTSTRVEMNGADNAIYHYDSGNKRTQIKNSGISFFNSSGVLAGIVYGIQAGEVSINAGGSDIVFDADSVHPNNVLSPYADLGTASDPWDNAYIDSYIQINDGGIFFMERGGGGDSILLRAPTSIAADFTLTLPTTDGSSGEYLKTDGSGNLSWDTPSSSGANTSLSNLSSVAINQDLVPGSSTLDIGDSSTPWDRLYVDDIYLTNNDGYIYYNNTQYISFAAGPRIEFDCYVDPVGAGTYNLGGSVRYWNDVSYKTLTDRGCLGWYDDGVELQDGKIVSDTEALLSLKKHPTLKTPAGAARIDYKSMPKHVYKKATSHDGKELPRDENDNPYEEQIQEDGSVKKVEAQDGAETTALIAIMVGAIKELTLRVKDLEESVEKLSKKANE